MTSRSKFFTVITALVAFCAFSYWVVATKAVPAPAPNKAAAPIDTLRFAPGAEQLSYLDIAPVEELSAPSLRSLPGKLSFDEDHTVRVSSPVLGRVAQLVAQPGAAVNAGDVLAWLDSPDFAQARAEARKAQADLSLKRKALERVEDLTKLGVLARKDFESAQADFSQAKAELDRAWTVLKNLDPSGDGTRYALRAPIAGIVVDRTINPGMQVRPDSTTPMFIITDPSHLWINFELSERDLGKVHNGQNVRADVDAFPDAHFSGRIVYIGAALDPATRRMSVRAILDNSDARLKPEMFARASPIDDDGHKQAAVPNSALISVGLHHYVFVEESAGVLKRREVQLGVVGEKSAFISNGLRGGELIVTRGAVLLNAELGQAE